MMGASIIATLMSSVAPIFLMQGLNIAPERIARGAVHALVLGARSAVDLRYDGIVYDERSHGISLRDVSVVPPAEAGLTDCTIRAEAMTLTPSIAEDTIGLRVEADGVTATPGCASEAGMVVVAMFGPDALNADRASIDLDYAMGNSGLSMTAFLQTAQTGTVDLALAASGLHMGTDDVGDPKIAGTLDAYEITVDDIDGLRGLLPMLGAEDDAAEQAVGLLRDGLGDVADTPAGKDFLDSSETQITRFLDEGGALTVRMNSDAPVPFSAFAETSGPMDTVPMLKPIFTARPQAGESLLVWKSLDAMQEALESAPPERKLEIAQAFASGTGVPKSEAMAATLYAELAADGDAQAAMAAALLLSKDDPERAYALALDAGAADAAGARLTLDRIEAGLSLETVLDLQGDTDADDSEPVAEIAELRRRARMALEGQGHRRSYAAALYNASLASAAGDRASGQLHARLAARYADNPAWAAMVSDASERALETWLSGGLGANFVE